ncbi:hypothetical protein H2248_008982 [Termitomyces sp. 'cryptogamus']|nr:hypothetical protein H2248_008982 [Termitomyces sp. 'cryptogamus']
MTAICVTAVLPNPIVLPRPSCPCPRTMSCKSFRACLLPMSPKLSVPTVFGEACEGLDPASMYVALPKSIKMLSFSFFPCKYQSSICLIVYPSSTIKSAFPRGLDSVRHIHTNPRLPLCTPLHIRHRINHVLISSRVDRWILLKFSVIA